MIISQYQEHQHFEDIENELISKLDSLFMSDSKADDLSRAFFISQLRHLFESSNVEEQLRDRVSHFLDSVDLFLEMLLSVRALPEGEEFSDDRVIATVRQPLLVRLVRAHHLVASPHELHSPHWSQRDLYQICASTRQCGCYFSAPPPLHLSLPESRDRCICNLKTTLRQLSL
jgi:dedicator of cytokinesis protein 3